MFTGPSPLARPARRERTTLFVCAFLPPAPALRWLSSCRSPFPRRAWAFAHAAPPLAPVGLAPAAGAEQVAVADLPWAAPIVVAVLASVRQSARAMVLPVVRAARPCRAARTFRVAPVVVQPAPGDGPAAEQTGPVRRVAALRAALLPVVRAVPPVDAAPPFHVAPLVHAVRVVAAPTQAARLARTFHVAPLVV